jgi:hypothetical protein
MLIVQSTTDILRVVTGQAADIEVHVSWMDKNGSTFTPGRTNLASITTATTTNIIDMTGVAAGTYRNIKLLSLRNNHASTACTITIEHNDGTNIETLVKCILLPGETLIFSGNGCWRHYKASGAVYSASGPMATQSQMETGTSTSIVVSPGTQKFHPSHPKFWAKFGISGNILDSWQVSSVSDDGVGLATATLVPGFSASTGWIGQITTERAATSLAVADARDQAITSTVMGVDTMVVECWNHATTAARADPAAWHIAGYGDEP